MNMFSMFLLKRISQYIIFTLLAINVSYAMQKPLYESPLQLYDNISDADSDDMRNDISSSNRFYAFHSENAIYAEYPSMSEEIASNNEEAINSEKYPETEKPVNIRKYYTNVVYEKPDVKKRSQPTYKNKSSYKKPVSKKKLSHHSVIVMSTHNQLFILHPIKT